ncbi:hypothetical protein AGR4C_Cc80251 [Agrobacterium tumefaciens str. Kerr 14]|uniref:Uncharacterized protein n=1 Tax=Agrobacterium tumefaciens str. Kerr 14 TaxID=1183424 RepID=A0A1S7QLR2_AGRTU|nr:hypothetical protein AGR4C_Cc80251 [Agrobacterium tumefaciens str. Kerr 14]
MFDKAMRFELWHERQLILDNEKIKKAAKLFSAFQLEYRHIRTIKREILLENRGMAAFEIPDIAQEIDVYPFGTSLRHFGPRLAVTLDRPADGAPQAEPARHAHPENDVGPRQAHIERRRVAAVHQPALFGDDGGYPLPLLMAGARLPAGQPENLPIHGDITKPEIARELLRKRRLAAAGTANDQYALRAGDNRGSIFYPVKIVRHLIDLIQPLDIFLPPGHNP